MTAFIAVFLLLDATGEERTAGTVAQICLLAASFCLNIFLFMWFGFLATIPLRKCIFYYAIAHLLSSLFAFLISFDSSGIAAAGFLLARPALTAVCLKGSMLKEAQLAEEPTDRSYSELRKPAPYKLVGIFVLSSMVNQLTHVSLPFSFRVLSLLGVFTCAACIIIAVLLFFDRFSLNRFFKATTLLCMVGPLCSLLGASGITSALFMGSVFSNAAFIAFEVILAAALCSIVYRFGVNPIWLFAVWKLASSISILCLFLLNAAIPPSDGSILIYGVLTIFVVICFLWLTLNVTEHDLNEAWGLQIVSGSSKSLTSQYGTLTDAISETALTFSLTRREEEILYLLIQEGTLPEIAKGLFISDSTIKSHTRHIYQKIGVKNRKELQAFMCRRTGLPEGTRLSALVSTIRTSGD